MSSSSLVPRSQKITTCVFVSSAALAEQLRQILEGDRYDLQQSEHLEAFWTDVNEQRNSIDCFVLEDQPHLEQIVHWLHRQAILLPMVILHAESQAKSAASHPTASNLAEVIYHTAEVHINVADLATIPQSIERAIAQFLVLSTPCRLPTQVASEEGIPPSSLQKNLISDQQRLSEKLKERLGYLGVYYKRDPQLFYRNLSRSERHTYLLELKQSYRDIILNYFREGSNTNQKIDEFVNTVFFADLSVSQVIEIHMDLMGKFAKKLKLEGRNEDILLDYRLTLIDIIAHLCEMYRRSIPRIP